MVSASRLRPALPSRCPSSPGDVLLRPVPALLLRPQATGHQLQRALLPALRGLHHCHPASHRGSDPARAHPQLLPAEHGGGLHGIGSGWELPPVLRGAGGLQRCPGAGEGGTAVPRWWAVGCPCLSPRPTDASRAQGRNSEALEEGWGRGLRRCPCVSRLWRASAAPAAGRELRARATQDRASVRLSLAMPHCMFPCRCHNLRCYTAFAISWGKTLLAGCRQKVIATGCRGSTLLVCPFL